LEKKEKKVVEVVVKELPYHVVTATAAISTGFHLHRYRRSRCRLRLGVYR
jgi:hypothetical protein